MNSRATPLLFFILTLALAGSFTLNIIQHSNNQNSAIKKARNNVLANIKDIRRMGVLIENNPAEGWFVISSETLPGQTEKLKVWLAPGASVVRSKTQTGTDGVVNSVEAELIEQKDLHIGEQMFALLYDSREHKRLEITTVWVGQILPYSK